MSRPAAHLANWTRSCAKEWPVLVLAVVAAGLFVWHCLWVGDAKIDDAYITFSFSKNLALGNGPIFSHGVRVEGYSTFLWMVLVAVPLVFTRGAAPLTCARVMGGFFVALLGWAVYRLARTLGASRAVAGACVLLLTLNTDLVVAYLTGMETVPYVAVVAFACAAAARSVQNPRWTRWAAWAGLAVALMRIDGFVPWGAIMGWSFLRAFSRGDRKAMRAFVRTFGPPVLVYAVWFLWRWHYYGLPLPSTYYAKALTPKLMPERGPEYVAAEVSNGWLWAGFLGWVWLVWRRRMTAALLGCFVLVHWYYVASVGGDWMPFGRFILPTVPLVVVLLVVGGADVVACAFRAKSRFRWFVPAFPLALAAAVAMRMDHRLLNTGAERLKMASVTEAVEHVGKLMQAAEVLNEIVPPGGHLVSDYGGIMGYYTDAHIIEMWGLANAAIATRGGTEGVRPFYGRTCPSCYPELDPEYFHVMQPLMRSESAFASAGEVIANVWQTDTIGRYIDFKSTFAVGRAYSPKAHAALFFLQKRGDGFSPSGRRMKSGVVVDYPFEAR